VAISRIDAAEAAKVLAALEQIDLREEFFEDPATTTTPNRR
jgi:hypothetical protein